MLYCYEMKSLKLTPELQKQIDERLKAGLYASAQDVVAAALHSLERAEAAGDFEPGEWDKMLEEAETGGESLDGERVLAELRQLRTRHQSRAR
jgi:Arc/MetJ-type ribon-helix-helix transcriptional regulator